MFYHIMQAKKGVKAPTTLKLKPQIPRLPLEDGNGVFLEDSTTPRTCFAHSIAECVEAIKDYPGEEYWVYGTSKLAGFYDPSRKSKKLLGAQSYSDAGVGRFLRKLVGDHYSLRLPAVEVKAINRALEPVFEGVVLDIAGTNEVWATKPTAVKLIGYCGKSTEYRLVAA